MVATFTDLKSSATAVSYYEKDGYYAKDDPEHRKASFWFGSAAAAAGLKSHVHPDRFEEALRGEIPREGVRLGRMREGEREHRPGWDLTLSAPKSVSLEGLVYGDRRVIRAHDDAVRATLAWVEENLLQTRGWDPATRKRPRVKASGMVAAGFRHLTSRNLDPQLHTHCVIANMTRDLSGNWKSVDPTAMRRAKRLIGAFYRNELARRLQGLGMATAPTLIGGVPGFELAGYGQGFLDEFSSRRREILEDLKGRGLRYTAASAQAAALRTRRPKGEVPIAELVPVWRERAMRHGLGRRRDGLMPAPPRDPETGERAAPPRVEPPMADERALRTLRRTPALPKLPQEGLAGLEAASSRLPAAAAAPATLPPDPELGVLEAVARAVEHHEERRTVIAETEIRTMALGHAPGRHTVAAVDAAIGRLVAEGTLVETVREGMDRAFVTDRTVASERKVLAMMRAGRGRGRRLADGDAVEGRLGASRLTDGQKAAARTLLLSDDWLVGVQGHAGSGKTTMLRTVKESLGTTRTLGLATAAAAALVLEEEAGIEARTIAGFLGRYGDLSDPERLRRARAELSGAVLVVDEASMIGTAVMERLLRTARRLDVARVALVGDTRQLRAVDAGQPFHLLQRGGMQVARMTEVLRQRKPELRAVVASAREGAPKEAIERLGPRVREAGREDLGREAAREWLAMSAQERAEAMILVPTHEIRRQANRAVREGLEDEGALGGRTLAIDRLVPRNLTRAQAADTASWEPGDTVVFHRPAYGRHRDDVCTVTRIEGEKVVLVDDSGSESAFRPAGNNVRYLQLYDTERIEIRAGDRIRWTRNRRSPGRRGRGAAPAPDLVNGQEARVLEIGPQRVRFRDGRGRGFSLARTDPQMRHLDHAYASTVHAAQGRTARAAIAVLDSHGVADQALFNVQVSRASDSFTLLTDDREALMEALERSPVKEGSALEALGDDPAAAPAVDAEVFEALAADWRGLEREARETGEAVFLLAGYPGVMARAAVLAGVEGLPPDMRALVDAMLERHDGHRARTGELRRIVEGLRDHVRRRPELGWVRRALRLGTVEDVPGHGAWRSGGAELAERARAALGGDGGPARHPDATPAGRAALERGLEALERALLMDDVERFGDRWRDLRRRARRTGVPEIHCEGYDGTAGLGRRIYGAGGPDGDPPAVAAEWRAVHLRQARLVDDVRGLLGEVDAWLRRWTDGRGAADPRERRTRRGDGEGLRARAEAMLGPGSAHAPHLAAILGTRDVVAEVADALRADEHAALIWLERTVKADAEADGIEMFHHTRYVELIALVRALALDDGLPENLRRLVGPLMAYDDIWTWMEGFRALQATRPGTAMDPENMASWCGEAADLLAGAPAIQAGGRAHAPHLAAMQAGLAALDDAVRQLGRELPEVKVAEMDRFAEMAEAEATEAGAAVFETASWGEALARARSLKDRDGLPPDLDAAAQRHLGRQRGWDDERERVGAFLRQAAEAEEGRKRLDLSGWRPESLDEIGWGPSARAARAKADGIREDVPAPRLAGHLRALGREEDAIEGLADRLAVAEMNWCMGMAETEAQEKSIPVIQTDLWRQALELAHSLDAREDLAPDLRPDVRRPIDRQERWDREHQLIKGFIQRADHVEKERTRLDETAGRRPGSPEEMGWLGAVQGVRDMADRLMKELSMRDFVDHLRALGLKRNPIKGSADRLAVAEMNLLAEMAEAGAAPGVAVFEHHFWGRALELARPLAARDDLPPDLRAPALLLLRRHEAWEKERERIDTLLKQAQDLADRHRRLTGTAGRQPGSSESFGWQGDAQRVRDEADRIREDVPARDLADHLRALGRAENEIGEWVDRLDAARMDICIDMALAEAKERGVDVFGTIPWGAAKTLERLHEGRDDRHPDLDAAIRRLHGGQTGIAERGQGRDRGLTM